MQDELTIHHVERIASDGYTVLENVIETELLDALSEAIERLERELGARPATNDFEGRHTLRLYNLLARDRVFERVPVHPEVLPIVERVLDRGCLISSCSSISIAPGESAQPIHADDQLIPIPKPHPAIVCNSMWALTDFTASNGATRIVPGSHLRAEDPPYGQEVESIPAEMKRGSVLVWNGGLWHGGGANETDRTRVGIAMNYCAGYLRQQENQQLGIPVERVRAFSPRLRRLVGYGTYRHLIGHIDKKSAEEVVLGAEGEFRSVWERSDSGSRST